MTDNKGKIRHIVWVDVCRNVEDNVRCSMEDKAWSSIEGIVRSSFYNGICDIVMNKVWSNVRSNVWRQSKELI